MDEDDFLKCDALDLSKNHNNEKSNKYRGIKVKKSFYLATRSRKP